MSDSLSVYLNTVGTNNIFAPDTTPTVEDNVDDYNFVSKTYNPTIESDDEDGDVQIEDKKDKKDEPTALQNVWSGTKTIVGDSTKGVIGMIGGAASGFWSNAGTMFKGLGQGVLGAAQMLSTPVVGMVKAIGSGFNNGIKGIGQIFRGQIFKGIGSIFKGFTSIVTEPAKWMWGGVKKIAKGFGNVAKGVAKGVVSVGKAIGKGVAKVGKAIGKGIAKIFKGW